MSSIVDQDPWLEPYREVLGRREHYFGTTLHEIEQQGGLLGHISLGHKYFGLNAGEQDGIAGVWYREWAPAALALSLVGDFNNWDRSATRMECDENGVWSCFIPGGVPHGCRHKVHVISQAGGNDRIPAYATRVVQEEGGFVAVYWPPARHVTPPPFASAHGPSPTGRELSGTNSFPVGEKWSSDSETDGVLKRGVSTSTNPSPPNPLSPRKGEGGHGLKIYEAHVGMATEDYKVGTFNEFREKVLPRIKWLGYNAVQLMAVQEHPYYGSFGYHVSNFFAVSSRFGTPEDLRELINEAHRMGLVVLLDLVHSHSVKNTDEGLFLFDGTQHQYFHAEGRGHHPTWDSLLFDYSKYEVRRFLLSNIRYWLEEYGFDGFRFDGVTSMLYHDHGLGEGFASYDAYFGPNADDESILYLKLANKLAHLVKPGCITVAEDVSGMPGLARPVEEMGLGFDYRLAMGIPDFWFKHTLNEPDESWNLNGIYSALLNRRRNEKHVAYVESHDQALVGDKTLAFTLMDKAMYDDMAKGHDNPLIDRGIALHKMIRLLTFSLGGEGYLNFMGNEFGHPEWIDFPREGNGWSYHYARRQWSLAENGFLRYEGLKNFDRAMLNLDSCFGLLQDPLIEQLACHENTRQLVYRRGPLVFVFNFHPTESYTDLQIPLPEAQEYVEILSTDSKEFSGHGRSVTGTRHAWIPQAMYGRDQSARVYLPTRTALVLAPARLSKEIVLFNA